MYLKTPISGYIIYSKGSPRLNEINDHWMSKIDIEQVGIYLMKHAEFVSTYYPIQRK